MRVSPHWLITDDYEDIDLGALKAGKEAEVFLIERASVVDQRSCLLAHKRYIPTKVGKGDLEAGGFSRARAFAGDAPYWVDKRFKKRAHREKRAAEKKTNFGRSMLFELWASQEWAHLVRLHDAGVSVPYPVERTEDGVLMQFLGDQEAAAPRLAQARLTPAERDLAFTQVVEDMARMVGANVVHADLSPYNLLWWEGRAWVIDLPQAVSLLDHPQGFDLLHRDAANICRFFKRDADSVFASLVSQVR